ncbi:MAG: RHS repeat-associated core domain-containing protein [Oceanospirillaceae bacterium]
MNHGQYYDGQVTGFDVSIVGFRGQSNTLPFGEDVQAANNERMKLRFPGQYKDQETGYSQNYFRDYDASLGRYIQSDPIGLMGGINTFAYVGVSPLKYSDSKGLCGPCVSITMAVVNYTRSRAKNIPTAAVNAAGTFGANKDEYGIGGATLRASVSFAASLAIGGGKTVRENTAKAFTSNLFSQIAVDHDININALGSATFASVPGYGAAKLGKFMGFTGVYGIVTAEVVSQSVYNGLVRTRNNAPIRNSCNK